MLFNVIIKHPKPNTLFVYVVEIILKSPPNDTQTLYVPKPFLNMVQNGSHNQTFLFLLKFFNFLLVQKNIYNQILKALSFLCKVGFQLKFLH
jgi:hypothetical protein